MANGRVMLGIRVEAALRDQLKVHCAQHRTDANAVVGALIEEYLKNSDKGGRIMVVSHRHKRLVEQLAEILTSGRRDVIGAIQQNIEVFHELIKLKRGRP